MQANAASFTKRVLPGKLNSGSMERTRDLHSEAGAPRLTERRRFSGGPGGSRSARLCQGPTRLRDLRPPRRKLRRPVPRLPVRRGVPRGRVPHTLQVGGRPEWQGERPACRADQEGALRPGPRCLRRPPWAYRALRALPWTPCPPALGSVTAEVATPTPSVTSAFHPPAAPPAPLRRRRLPWATEAASWGQGVPGRPREDTMAFDESQGPYVGLCGWAHLLPFSELCEKTGTRSLTVGLHGKVCGTDLKLAHGTEQHPPSRGLQESRCSSPTGPRKRDSSLCKRVLGRFVAKHYHSKSRLVQHSPNHCHVHGCHRAYV